MFAFLSQQQDSAVLLPRALYRYMPFSLAHSKNANNTENLVNLFFFHMLVSSQQVPSALQKYS